MEPSCKIRRGRFKVLCGLLPSHCNTETSSFETITIPSIMPSSTLDSEETPLLAASTGPPVQAHCEPCDHVSPRIKKRLYISHFLSTWNSRVFEFGAVLYLATIFPHTLLPLSVYALTRGISAIFLSPALGRYIDTSNRLTVVRLSISKSGGV
jgi:iron-regulated transporter 1